MRRWLKVAVDKTPYPAPKREAWDGFITATAPTSAEIGDVVALWRKRPISGVVAIGHIAKVSETKVMPSYRRNEAESDRKYVEVKILLDSTSFSRPLYGYTGSDCSLKKALKAVNSASKGQTGERCTLLDVSDDEWRALLGYLLTPPPAKWPSTWNIPPGALVKRSQLHAVYGGNRRMAASSSGRTPNAFIFFKRTEYEGETYPQWDGDILIGPGNPEYASSISSENMAILDHYGRGRPLRAFEGRHGSWRYLGEFIVDQELPISHWVPTGNHKEHYGVAGETHRWVFEVPLLRLKQIDGIKAFAGDTDPFRHAELIELDLDPSATKVVGASAEIAQEDESDPNTLISADSHSFSPQASQDVQTNAMAKKLSAALANPGVIEQLASEDIGENIAAALLSAVKVHRLHRAVEELRRLLQDETREEKYQSWCERHSWVFGNTYVSRDPMRHIAVGDTIDLMMESSLNSMRDIFELKRPDMKVLIFDSSHKSWYWSSDVSKAIGQCHRYLDKLQEQARLLVQDFPDLVAYHPRATVVIGRSNGWGEAEQRGLHGLNARLHGISVITYDHLLAQAEATLASISTTIPFSR